MTNSPVLCPLCGQTEGISLFHKDREREYHRCPRCQLVFVPEEYFLSAKEEKEEYETHENSPESEGYRKFLSRLFTPLNSRLAPKQSGLDFGSGPGPTLSLMFEESGHTMSLYDPFYAPDRAVLSLRYDFVTATEVVEHFYNPARDFSLLWLLVRPGGWLGIMTSFLVDSEKFAHWHYKRDKTHVCFYSVETMDWIASEWNASVVHLENGVTLFQKI
ncbi:class I SAM-dependent methyltransferase [bacterium]|nr:class I SAM-dependent methyltransferase [bacterium]